MTLTNMTTLVQKRQRRVAARLSAPSKPNLPDCQRLLVALREHSLCFYVNFIVNIMIYYVKCYCLVYLLFLIIILTSDISSVLNCPAWGMHYFHNRYFFCFLLFLFQGTLAQGTCIFNTFLDTNTGGPLFSELLSDFFCHVTFILLSILCVINIVFGLTQFNNSKNLPFHFAVFDKKINFEKTDFRAHTW